MPLTDDEILLETVKRHDDTTRIICNGVFSIQPIYSSDDYLFGRNTASRGLDQSPTTRRHRVRQGREPRAGRAGRPEVTAIHSSPATPACCEGKGARTEGAWQDWLHRHAGYDLAVVRMQRVSLEQPEHARWTRRGSTSLSRQCQNAPSISGARASVRHRLSACHTFCGDRGRYR